MLIEVSQGYNAPALCCVHAAINQMGLYRQDERHCKDTQARNPPHVEISPVRDNCSVSSSRLLSATSNSDKRSTSRSLEKPKGVVLQRTQDVSTKFPLRCANSQARDRSVGAAPEHQKIRNICAVAGLHDVAEYAANHKKQRPP